MVAYGLQHTDSRICIVSGRYPIFDRKGDKIGAIGVSGGSLEDDCEACLVWMRKLGFGIDFNDAHADAVTAV